MNGDDDHTFAKREAEEVQARDEWLLPEPDRYRLTLEATPDGVPAVHRLRRLLKRLRRSNGFRAVSVYSDPWAAAAIPAALEVAADAALPIRNEA